MSDIKKVYLSGYMNAEVHATKEWRDLATNVLSPRGIRTLNPWRGKSFSYYTDSTQLTSPRLLVDRDLTDMVNSDVILINLNDYGIQRQMVGTLAELGVAGILHKPTVIFADEGDPILSHPFPQGIGTKVCNSLAEALNWVIWLTQEDLP